MILTPKTWSGCYVPNIFAARLIEMSRLSGISALYRTEFPHNDPGTQNGEAVPAGGSITNSRFKIDLVVKRQKPLVRVILMTIRIVSRTTNPPIN